MTFPSADARWPLIDAYLRSKGIRIDNPTLGKTEGGGHVAGSEHYQHRARDYPTSSCDAPAIAHALEPFAKGPNHIIDELFYSGTRTWYADGTYFVPAVSAIEYKNHFSHVHAGIRRGASLPTGTPPKPLPVPPVPAPPTPPEEDDMATGVFITSPSQNNTWHFFNGVHRRPVGTGEPQRLVDLKLVAPGADGKPFVKSVDDAYLAAIPIAAGY